MTENPSRFRNLPWRRLALLALLAGASVAVAQARPGAHPSGGSGGHGVTTTSSPPPRARIEAAFVLDTTGSMSGLLEGAKQKVWSIVEEMGAAQQQVDLRLALVAYRDRGDDYITSHLDLTTDLDHLDGRLRALQAAGGGDGPESVNQALHEALTALSWSEGPGTYRAIFLVGDAPPHHYADDVSWRETVALARQRGIVVNTVQCGNHPETAQIWGEIARLGAGQYAAIAQDGAMVAVATPYDDELAKLGRELAATVVPWGDADERRELEEKVERSLEAPAPKSASRLSYLAKRGGRANLGRADLVDAYREGDVDLAAVPPASLPAEMRDLSADERGSYVQQKVAERVEIQERVEGLSRQRKDYLEEEQKRREAAGEPAGFDRKVMDAVRAQAAAAGITYE